ncbi:hypothetical protein GQ55_7G040500 [Panicum hallii var. hallii]|uniref:Uncharacterized protein n=1 Tax=Panicum hallii var. hallii TaxID=1504633 RepID=A0A2T7CSM3_9POAL|nr:hypothetical protein GQ55_7G040500 [Panicum hallii var. hallii]
MRGFRCVAHFLPFHHPPTPLPQKTPQPPLIFLPVSTSSSIHSSTPDADAVGREKAAGGAGSPSLPRRRSTPIGAACTRGMPIGARAALRPI